MTIKALWLAGVAATMFALPAAAHHSFAMFDHNKTSSMEGTVKEFEWINPHAWVHMTVADAAGKAITWSFEAGSTGQLTQAGWKRDDIKVGDKIVMGFHPLKDGSFGGQVLTVKLADGRTLCQGNECEAERGRE
jgi:hypothetical protein